MSSTAIMRALLVNHSPLTTLVPGSKVFVGAIPQGTVLPAVLITEVDGYPRAVSTTRNQSHDMIEARVQVTVQAKSYADMKRILLAAKLGKGVHSGRFGNYRVKSVLPAGVNPELPPADDGIFEQSRDFMVTFMEAN